MISKGKVARRHVSITCLQHILPQPVQPSKKDHVMHYVS